MADERGGGGSGGGARSPVGELWALVFGGGDGRVGLVGRVDPGLLLVLAGVLVISAGMLIPAVDGLRASERERDVARAVEAWQGERIVAYEGRIAGLREPDASALRGLAARELNLMPAGSVAVGGGAGGAFAGGGALTSEVEPGLVMPVEAAGRESVLGRMVRGGRSRVLLLGGGAVLVLFGLAGGWGGGRRV